MQLEDVHKLYSSPNIVVMIKSEGMRWVMNVARIEDVRDGVSLQNFGCNAERIKTA
jgi:uncharacterized protein YccT (UPF0319 family)